MGQYSIFWDIFHHVGGQLKTAITFALKKSHCCSDVLRRVEPVRPSDQIGNAEKPEEEKGDGVYENACT